MCLGAGSVWSVSLGGLVRPGSCCFTALGHNCPGASLGSEQTVNLEKVSEGMDKIGSTQLSSAIKSTKKTEGAPGTQWHSSAPHSWSPK